MAKGGKIGKNRGGIWVVAHFMRLSCLLKKRCYYSLFFGNLLLKKENNFLFVAVSYWFLIKNKEETKK